MLLHWQGQAGWGDEFSGGFLGGAGLIEGGMLGGEAGSDAIHQPE
jgi:hypothetical protein